MSRVTLTDPDELEPYLRDLHDNALDDDWSTRHCARAFASHPRLLEGYLNFYYPWHSEGGLLPRRLKELVRLRIATLNGCQTCKAARLARDEIPEAEALQVDNFESGESYSEREKVALRFAEKMAVDHFSVDDDYISGVREHFSEPEFLELAMMTGQFIGFGRVLAILQLEEVSCPI